MNDVEANVTTFGRITAWIDRLCGLVDQGVRKAIVCMVAIIFLLLVLQVVMRYVIRTPLIWVEELSSYTLAFLVLWGGASLIRSWGHIHVDTFYALMPRLLRTVVAILLNLLLVYFGYILVRSGHRLAILGSADLSPSGTFNLFWPRQAMTTGGALIALQALNNVLRVCFGRDEELIGESSRTTEALKGD